MGYIAPGGYALQVQADYLAAFADSLTYYWGAQIDLAPSTTADMARLYIPRAGIIRGASIFFFLATPSTAEDMALYIRKNNTTDYAINATQHLDNAHTLASNYALNIPVAQGDYIEIKAVCPAWATNPGGISTCGSIWIE